MRNQESGGNGIGNCLLTIVYLRGRELLREMVNSADLLRREWGQLASFKGAFRSVFEQFFAILARF